MVHLSRCIARAMKVGVLVRGLRCVLLFRSYLLPLLETMDCSQCSIGGQSAQASSARDRG